MSCMSTYKYHGIYLVLYRNDTILKYYFKMFKIIEIV
jgi:hypothetical protein